MSFPLKLDVVSSKDVKSKKRWKKVDWDGEESENISLLGSKTLAQFNLVSGKKRRVDASLRKVLGRVVYITGSLSGSCIVGLLQDGNLFRWRKNTRTITNIGPCPDFTRPTMDQSQGHAVRKLKLFISDNGSTIMLFSQWHGIRLWRSSGYENSGWTNINVGPTMSLITSKGVSVDTIFYADKVIGKICRSAFASFSGDTIFVGVLFLKYEEHESSQNYAFHRYSLSDFKPRLTFTSLRDSVIPCWSRNGLTLAVAVNQCIPSCTKILLIHPISGGVITVSFATMLKNAVEMSFWITGLSWMDDNLFFACITKQGAVALISSNGFVMKIMARSPAESFGPGIFLPLDGVLGFRRPPVDMKYPDVNDSTDTSMQSTILPPKRRKPHYSISMHPTLKLLLCADGYSVAVMKLTGNITFVDMIVFSLAEIVQRIKKVINDSGLQVEILEPLSYFLPLSPKKVQSEKEERWRNVIKSVRVKLFPEQFLDGADEDTTEKPPEQLALISFLMDNLDDSHLNQSVSQQEIAAKNDTVQAGADILSQDLKCCNAALLSTLILMKMWFAQKADSTHWRTEQSNDRLTKNELIAMYSDTFKLYCDILLQVQDIADILPDNSANDSLLSSNVKPLREEISAFLASLGKGILSAIHWTDLSTPMSSIIPNLVEEVVRTTLSCGTHSSEGCITGKDMQRNLKKTFRFLTEAEKCYMEQSQRHMKTIFGISLDLGDNGYNDDVKFSTAWRMLYKITTKAFPRSDPLLAHLQCRLSDNMVLPSQEFANEEIRATKALLLMCENLRNYNFTRAISHAYDILCSLVLNHKKWTAEKWFPIEVLATTMCAYFCGTPVYVPSLMATLSKSESNNALYNHSSQLQQQRITASIRTQSLDESWNLNSAALLLLCCGRIEEAAKLASDVGDWRTSFVLHAISEKVHYVPKSTQNFKTKSITTNVLLRQRCDDILSSIFGVKVQVTDDSFHIKDKSLVKFSEVDAVPYAKSLRDLFEIAAMINCDVTTPINCALLNAVKSVSLYYVRLHIPMEFKLPHPQLFLPQSFSQNSPLDEETTLRHEISAYVRVLLIIFNCIGAQRVVALWYLKWLDRELVEKSGESSRKSFIDEFALLKDVTLQGLELNLDGLHASDGDFEVNFLAAVFREMCAILWFFHIRDNLAVALRKYQSLREQVYDPCFTHEGVPDGNHVTVETMYQGIDDCLFWVEKLIPFSKFFHLEVEINEIILCLISELPFNVRSAVTLARHFYRKNHISAKNKHRLQAILERMRTVNIQNSTGDSVTPLSSVFENECRKFSQNRPSFTGHFHAPRDANIIGTSVDGSQADTLSREESSIKSKISSEELMETLQESYIFESDDLFHKFVFDFLEIVLSKSPATATFTPKKDRIKGSSAPMQYPYLLTYRSEIAKMNLETILQPTKQKEASLTMMVPLFEKSTSNINKQRKIEEEDIKETSNGHQRKNEEDIKEISKGHQRNIEEEADVSNTEELSTVMNWDYFKTNKTSDKETKSLQFQQKMIPRLSLKDMSPQFCKKIHRLSPYFEWLEHWRTQIVSIPRNVTLNKDAKPSMRVTISTEHIFHGFTIAEKRFGKLGKIKSKIPVEQTQASVPENLKSDATGQAISSDFSNGSDTEANETLTITTQFSSNDDDQDTLTGENLPDTSPKSPPKIDRTLKTSDLHSNSFKETAEKELKSKEEKQHSEMAGDSTLKESVVDESLPKVDHVETMAPIPSSGKFFDEILQKDTDEETLNPMSHSNVTVTSTGLQSDLIPDGGGKAYPSHTAKLQEKEEMKNVVRTEIQNAMIGQQVLFLAQMFQSAMLHASNFLSQQSNPQQNAIREYPATQPRNVPGPSASTPKRNDGRMQILTLDGADSHIEQNSQFAKKPKRPVLKLLSENSYGRKSHTSYLHNKNENTPKLYVPEEKRSKKTIVTQPLLHKPMTTKTQVSDQSQFKKSVNHEATASNQPRNKSLNRAAATSTLTPDMLQQSTQKCPSCKSDAPPRMSVKLPLLNMASSIAAQSQYTQPVNELPRLIHIRQILRHEQKRMVTTGQQSQSVVPMGKALPLLGADNIPGFYKPMSNIQRIPLVPSVHRPHPTQEPPVEPIPAWEQREQQNTEVEDKIEIPRELLPKVLTSEEADSIKNSVLSHYKTIVDHQKLMWKEAGQQTEDVDNTCDTGVGPIEIPEPRPTRVISKPGDRFVAHQQFVEKFLDPQRDKVSDLDHVPIKELRAQDVTHMQNYEDNLKVPTVQNLVRSRFESVMDQMSSEMQAVDDIHRDLRSRMPISYDEPKEKPTSLSSGHSSVHFAPQVPHTFERPTTPSSHISASSRTEDFVAGTSFQTYIPPSDIISGNRMTSGNLYEPRERHISKSQPTQSSALDELSRYRRKIDEAFSLAEYGHRSSDTENQSRPASRQLTPSSSMHRMDENSLLSSLSWAELEAMVNDTLLAEAEPDESVVYESDAVDVRMRDALQLLGELQSEKPQIPHKAHKISSKQQDENDRKSKKREADVEARIKDAVNLLNEIKVDHNQVKHGKLTSQKRMTPVKLSATKSKPMDNWTMEAMSLLKELKSEFEPDQRMSVKENLPPDLFGKTNSDQMRAHLEEAMALLQDDDANSSTQHSLVPSSHVSFQPESQMPKRHY